MQVNKRMFPEGRLHPFRLGNRFLNPPPSQTMGICEEATSRTIAPPHFYIIDFGISVSFPSFQERKMLEGPRGQNLELPDFRNRFWDPFKVDIRTFGDMIKDIFIKVCDLTFTVEVSAKTCGRDFKILVSSYP